MFHCASLDVDYVLASYGDASTYEDKQAKTECVLDQMRYFPVSDSQNVHYSRRGLEEYYLRVNW
jgi:hypothetical protein